ncbi:ABC transporter permease [Streptomyces acidiscabies]|uniref:ABC transporter permease subunit n=1 Tax=Streptomyces acidiscabies TaxID=42234 RepID=A0AAP6BBB0_9ACTN|nr:ABC transporter permease subunit [Streptomyces acidiscabies]MBP5938058.1 ABC transporter permease subunit [Streptomyces sp. LBUM 1476]MBZ3909066.1 ABC transporter permease subunit [Streptomyces acidiscabies]MDX2961603.1 ABC transporter permease subunit [Streptomyces acidiscabies]MDX3016529.1 ABC transporter permease subunit [Streptomyces acidiscabies]MDX3788566.1 ABC transporter permease subunit [Streptomyces acidiscabies]
MTVRILRKALTGLGVGLLALFILGPLLWLFPHAFAGTWRYPGLLPQEWTLRWWRAVADNPDLVAAVRWSFIFAPVATLLSAVVCLPAAYAFSRFDFPGRRFFLVALFSVNAFPKIGLYVAMASLFYTLNLMTTFWGVVIVQLLGTVVFMTWLPAAAFSSVPRSLEEAARDAGAGQLTVFWRVTLPIARPGILVAVILSFLAAFDEAQGTLLVGAPVYLTMPTAMYSMVTNYPEGVAAVFSLLLSIPSVVLLFGVRRHIMGGHLAEGFQLR